MGCQLVTVVSVCRNKSKELQNGGTFSLRVIWWNRRWFKQCDGVGMPSVFVDALRTSAVLITLAGQGCSGKEFYEQIFH